MPKPESPLSLIEQAIQNPANQASETGRVYSFQLAIGGLRLYERVRLFVAPTNPLPFEEDVLNAFLRRLNPGKPFTELPFYGGAATHYLGQKRYWNDLRMGELSASTPLLGEASLQQAVKVNLWDPEVMERYSRSPLRVESLPLTAEQLVVVHVYPFLEIAEAVANYQKTLNSERLGPNRDTLIEDLTYTIPGALVERLDRGQPLRFAVNQLYPL